MIIQFRFLERQTSRIDAEKTALTSGNVEGVKAVDSIMTVVVQAADSRYYSVV